MLSSSRGVRSGQDRSLEIVLPRSNENFRGSAGSRPPVPQRNGGSDGRGRACPGSGRALKDGRMQRSANAALNAGCVSAESISQNLPSIFSGETLQYAVNLDLRSD